MNEVIIYDLEYTTWHGAIERNWSKENEIREITWIAAILVDVNTLQEIDSFDCIRNMIQTEQGFWAQSLHLN